jgi:hypothetical protein
MQTIKNYILQHKLMTILVAIIVVLGIILLFKNHKITKLKGQLNYATFHDSTETTLTKHGDSIKTVYVQQVKYIPDTKRYDSLLKEFNIKKKQAEQITTTHSNTHFDTITAHTTDTIYQDTGVRSYAYNDKYISFKAKAGKALAISNLNIPADVTIISSIQDKHKKISISSTNPHIDFNNIQSVDYTNIKTSSWSFGITAGATITTHGITPGATIGITKTIFRF